MAIRHWIESSSSRPISAGSSRTREERGGGGIRDSALEENIGHAQRTEDNNSLSIARNAVGNRYVIPFIVT